METKVHIKLRSTPKCCIIKDNRDVDHCGFPRYFADEVADLGAKRMKTIHIDILRLSISVRPLLLLLPQTNTLTFTAHVSITPKYMYENEEVAADRKTIL